VHSIPNNNDNQDMVSMGCNAALMTKKVIDNSFEVLTIQLMTIIQAIEYMGCQDRLSSASASVYSQVREIFPAFVEDVPQYKTQKKVKEFLETAGSFIPAQAN
jgi:histidine ammonia-lyase